MTQSRLTVVVPKRNLTVKVPKRNLKYLVNGARFTQTGTSWTTWGQDNIQVFVPGYTSTFGDLP